MDAALKCFAPKDSNMGFHRWQRPDDAIMCAWLI